MAKVINCECGFVARGDSDDEVVEVIQGHMASDHPQKFDPAAYKRTTRDQWDNAADAWDGWGPTIEELLDGATSTMFDLARIRPGARVLDVAAGAGGQSVAAARRAGPDGWVLATQSRTR